MPPLGAELVPPPHRIFLSQATLVVVPPELIDHWRTQVSGSVRWMDREQSQLQLGRVSRRRCDFVLLLLLLLLLVAGKPHVRRT